MKLLNPKTCFRVFGRGNEKTETTLVEGQWTGFRLNHWSSSFHAIQILVSVKKYKPILIVKPRITHSEKILRLHFVSNYPFKLDFNKVKW